MFKEPIEFAIALADGRKFKDKEGNFYFYDKEYTCPFRIKLKGGCSSGSLNDSWNSYDKVTEFFDFHDQFPILCYVTNNNDYCSKKVRVIKMFINDFYIDEAGDPWKNVKPITDKSLIYKNN